MSERLKILPLLILVAMLAFSVRLAEVVSGVRDLSGAAQAAGGEEVANPPPMPPEEALKPEGAKEDAKDGAKNGAQEAAAAVNQDAKDKPPTQLAAAPETKGADAATKEGAAADTSAQTPADAGKGKGAPDIEVPDLGKWRDASDSDGDVSAVKMEMFEDMAARRKELDKREQTLVTREALLKAAEQEIDRKFQEMEALRTQIEQLLKDQSEEEKSRIQSLVKVYEGMKPQEAARIFNTLDLDILVNVVSGMSERKLSPILAAMDPERARTVTIMLAEQKTLPALPAQ